MFLWTAVGTIAGVAGLAISIALIFITKGAKREAEEAKKAVQQATRNRSLIEELENVNHKDDQLGVLLQHQQWFAVQMRIQEITTLCSQILSRWPDGLSEEKRDDLLTAADLARSMSTKISATDPDAPDRGKLAGVQLRLSQRISSALGEARKTEERT